MSKVRPAKMGGKSGFSHRGGDRAGGRPSGDRGRQDKAASKGGKPHGKPKYSKPAGEALPLLVAPNARWYEVDGLPAIGASDAELDDEVKAGLLAQAKELLAAENKNYQSDSTRSDSQKQFFTEIITSGTLSDRTSALTLLIQESPLHSMKTMESLLNLASKKNRTAALQAVSALKDLFISGEVLPDRRLRWFGANAGLAKDTPREWLIVWAFEDWMKGFYFKFVQLLETLSHDAVVHVRQSVLTDIMDLLKAKPEQEANLLRLGVNKLGDLDKKTASKASHLILELEQAHPAMKPIIFNAISELVFRPNTDYHAHYYSMITLNQTIVTNKEATVANTLVEIYFTLFERILAHTKSAADSKVAEKKVKKKPRWKSTRNPKPEQPKKAETIEEVKEEQNMKLVSAILTGVNRAFPYSSLDDDVFSKHLSTLYFVARSGNFNTSIQALMLLFQISNSKDILSDRFFRALYDSLFDPRLITSSKQALYLNLVYKALKQDLNVKRAKAFVKRLIQIATETTNIGFAGGIIFMIAELEQTIPALRELLAEKEDDGESDVEVFHDARDTTPDSDDKSDEKTAPVTPTKQQTLYDGKVNDPLKSNADASCLWELLPLLNHYHPTVAHFAQNLYENKKNASRPDLALHTLSHFLDRFIYKSPKTKATTRGGSIMQPIVGSGAFESKDVLLLATKGAKASRPSVNTLDWASQGNKADAIAVEDQFFYRYFVSKGGKKKAAAAAASDEDEDEDAAIDDIDAAAESEVESEAESEAAEASDDGDEELDDEEVWDAIVKSRPELEDNDGDLDDSDGYSDLADAMSDDSDVEDDDEPDSDAMEEALQAATGVAAESDVELDDESDAGSGAGSDSSEDLDFGDEDEDLLDSDDQIELTAFDSSDDSDDAEPDADLMAEFEAENEGAGSTKAKRGREPATAKASKKRKTDDGKAVPAAKAKKMKLKDLPVFASVDDYKDLLSDDE
ncbi:CBF/Mak21 family-domain-containing protein [Dipodascopsis tothii]|uniref:CBF/Mak21 family-domain-containing protein n=1 Tax=Dipodascopsis tothii TaxID=44089 RepID=UPI0034CF988C